MTNSNFVRITAFLSGHPLKLPVKVNRNVIDPFFLSAADKNVFAVDSSIFDDGGCGGHQSLGQKRGK